MKKFYLFIILCLSSLGNHELKAQIPGPAKIWPLATTVPPGTYTARDWIELRAGFSFTANNNYFEAKIDETLPFDVEYMISQTNPDRPLEKTLPVGTTPSSFAVSLTGAATYSVPITVSPGTAGMKPSISVAYNSQVGNGLLGFGWNLSGLSAITRVPSTLYNDDLVDGVDLDENDRFALDGNRLIMISGTTYGGNGVEYRTETETYAVIKSYDTDADNSPEYFKVWTKEGVEIEYGSSTGSNSRFLAGTKAVFWYIDKITDPNGNYMTYTYYNSGSEFYIKEILYTGNAQASPVIWPYNRIEFLYVNQTVGKGTAYIAGTLLEQKVLLRKMNTYCDGNIYKTYNFSYYNTGGLDLQSRLAEIYETGTIGEKLNSTIIHWGTGTPSFVLNDDDYHPELYDGAYNFFYGDYNGDGRLDFVSVEVKDDYSTDDVWKLYCSNSSGTAFEYVSQGSLTEDFEAFYTGDLNGDAKTDMLMREKKINEFTNEDYWKYTPYISSGSGFNPTTMNTFTCDVENDVLISDYNGDGFQDCLVKREKVTGMVDWMIYSYKLFSNGTIGNMDYRYSGTIPSWGTELYEEKGWNIENKFAIDFNGNGKSDILILDGTGYKIYEFASAGAATEIFSGSTPCNEDAVWVGDYNGDGKSDMIVQDQTNSNFYVYYSTGISFNPILSSNLGPTNIGGGSFPGDYNGDGLMDLLTTKYYGNEIYFNIAYSKGNAEFAFDELPTGLSYTQWGLILNDIMITGDLNGDGNCDMMVPLCRFENSGIPYNYLYNSNYKKDVVTSITDGLNYKVALNYSPLTDEYAYTKEENAVFPVADIQWPVYVIKETTTPNGRGGNKQVTYTYKGAKIHRQGKGFLGFSEIKSTDIQTGFLTTQSFTQTHKPGSVTYYMPLPAVESVKLSDEILSQTTYEYNFHEFASKRVFPYARIITNDNYLLDTRNIKTATINADGNPTQILLSYGETSGSTVTWIANTRTDYSNYIDAITADGNSIPGKPQDITVTKSHADHNPNNFAVSTNLTYTTTGNVLKKIKFYGKPKTLTYDYEYHTTGNLLKVNITPADELNKRRYTTNEYDTWYRFVVKQKDVNNNAVEAGYDCMTGNITSTVDIYGNIATFEYDGFGRKAKTKLPGGGMVTQTTSWYSGSDIPNAWYYITTCAEGSGDVIEYFDILGRSIRKVSKGFDGSDIVSTAIYNIKGQLEETTSPAATGSNAISIRFEYDNYYRIDREILNNTYITDYTYGSSNGRNVHISNTSADPVQWIEKTVDALGNLKEVKDAKGTITYRYHASQQPMEITTPGGTTTIGYDDDYGWQSSLSDLDAGTILYTYTPFGELETQTDNRQNQYTMHYDKMGRLSYKSGPDGTTFNDYYTSGNGNTLLKKTTGPNGMYEEYTYDELCRMLTSTDYIEAGQTFTTSYEYDRLDRLVKIKYPNNFAVTQIYNSYGYLSEVRKADDNTLLWKGTGMNSMGQWTNYELGVGLLSTTRLYNMYGFPTEINTKKISTGVNVYKQQYDWNIATGNLNWRKELMHGTLTESFTLYDELNRLKSFANTAIGIINMEYDDDKEGNLIFKTDIGDMIYDGPHPHAVTQVSNDNNIIPSAEQLITYNSFNKVSNINEASLYKGLTISYGPSETRKKMYMNKAGAYSKTRYYSGAYEKEINSSTTREYCYIAGGDGLAAVYITTNGTGSIYYICKDYLGSINTLVDNTGSIAVFNGNTQEYSYDPWGRRRNPTDLSYNNVPDNFLVFRGYTGHEHLDDYKLINMNGRVYDPLLGRFLSPDNFVQSNSTQAFNRYAYGLNNPLIYTDPDGDHPLIIAAAIVGAITGTINLALHWDQVDNFWDGAAAFGIGFGAGFIGTVTGGSAFVAAGGGAAGLGGFIAGAFGGGVGYIYSSTFQNLGNAAYFGDPYPTTKEYLTGLGFSVVLGGAINGGIALYNGNNFWTGLPKTMPIYNGYLKLPDPEFESEVKLPNGGRTEIQPFNSNYEDPSSLKLPDRLSYYASDNPSNWTSIGTISDKPIYFTPNSELSRVSALNDLALPRIPNFRIDITGATLDPNKIMIIRRVTGNVFGQGGGGWEIVYMGPLNLNKANIVITQLP
jgi:RHS repeat-associated protein